jgi:Zn-dependent peptidase ImmA (M78 family)
MTITVGIGMESVPVDRDVFVALFDISVVSEYVGFTKALASGVIEFDQLVRLARKADIPYSLFFAPLDVVEAQLERKTNILLQGVRKEVFSMNSRSKVRLSDVELIVKDLLRKQDLIKRLDDRLIDNKVVGCIRRSRGVAADAETLRAGLRISVADIKAAKNKEAAFELLIERFEAQQVLVSRSQQNYMPQRLRERAKFSGMCVRDKKVPYIFLTNGDEGDNYEPAGRRIFTLTLLGVFVARGKFAPVTYDDHTDGVITDYEYQVTEEVLMPATEVRGLDASTLDAVQAGADAYRVTPSAFVMRAQRLGLIDRDQARAFMEELAADFASREKSRGWPATPINAIKRYNGAEFCRRMVAQLDRGSISETDFCRVMGLNKLKASQIPEFKAAL